MFHVILVASILGGVYISSIETFKRTGKYTTQLLCIGFSWPLTVRHRTWELRLRHLRSLQCKWQGWNGLYWKLGIEPCEGNLTYDFPFGIQRNSKKTPHEPRKKKNLLSIESWLFNDPKNGLLESPHNWVVFNPLHTQNNQGPFYFPFMKIYSAK